MQKIRLFGWDNTSVLLNVTGHWFQKNHGIRCVVGCNNPPTIAHISEKGYCNMLYCVGHAELFLIRDILFGYNSQGCWMQVRKGKLEPIWTYKDTILKIRTLSKIPRYWKRLRNIESKIDAYRRRHASKT